MPSHLLQPVLLGLTLSSLPVIATAAGACPSSGFFYVQPHATADTRPVRYQGKTLHVDRKGITSSSDLVEVRLSKGYDDGAVLIKHSPAGAERLTQATTDHDGARIAFLLNDTVLMAVTWEGKYGFDANGAQLSMTNRRTAERTVRALQACIKTPT